ncbi:MAG: hypothetical protein JWN62_3461, partial [Acidimicrobiales bacterium]|nr:hypothetical protein [Acidimicrobiales bacterium]
MCENEERTCVSAMRTLRFATPGAMIRRSDAHASV